MPRLAFSPVLAAALIACGGALADEMGPGRGSVERMERGVVESVHTLSARSPRAGLRANAGAPALIGDTLDRGARSGPVDQLVVRLDSDRLVVILHDGTQRFAPGHRVRLLPRAAGIQVELE